MAYTYNHPRPAVAVDIVLVREMKREAEILLIKRASNPFQGKWALPGGFMEMDETLIEAARRELEEETGLKAPDLKPVGVFDAPDRDPRGRVISCAFAGKIERNFSPQAASDAAQAAWHSLQNLPPLAFDHSEIISRATIDL